MADNKKPKRRGLALRLLGLVAVLLVAFVGVTGWRAIGFKSPIFEQSTVDISGISIQPEQVANHLAQAVQFATVSQDNEYGSSREAFIGLHQWLRTTYPLVFSKLDVTTVNEFGLLIKWQGSNASAQPLLLLAHQDVVPADADGGTWDHPPFSGTILDGEVWGRGSLDDKGSIITMLEVVEALLTVGQQPERTLIMAFGHDEEIGGDRGAVAIAAKLEQQGVQPWAILDEGYLILEDFPVTDKPTAFFGTAEKGYLTLRLSAKGEAGHSSRPPTHTAVSNLAEALVALQDLPIERSLDGAVGQMLKSVADDLAPVERYAIANPEVFGGLVKSSFEKTPGPRALLGTTVAPTVLSGSDKENVLAAEAHALINFRLHPRDSIASIVDLVTKQVAHVADITVSVEPGAGEATPPSPLGAPYAFFAGIVKTLDPEVAVAPGLLIGATDSRHYQALSNEIYRFLPYRMLQDDYGLHGANERISIENLDRAARFYAHAIMGPVSQ